MRPTLLRQVFQPRKVRAFRQFLGFNIHVFIRLTGCLAW